MTAQEFHRNFRFGMDKMDSLNYPNFQSEEIDLLLNQAQDRFVKQRYGTTNTKRTSFEETEKRTEDLKEIIQTDRLTGFTANSESIIYSSAMCQLPTNHWFTIWDKAIISCTKCNGTVTRALGDIGADGSPNFITGIYVEVRSVTHLDFEKVVHDAFKGPDHTKILKLMYKNQIELIISEDCTLISYEFRYIREPIRISLINNITCELSDHTHQEIVNISIDIALEGIEAKRQQSFPNKVLNTDE